ncbi:MAG: hypothetical protein QOK48_1711, partial [Blastocatellia bacterium]|nr:hypothetical protein [Blastocatellia bacterium]
MNRVSIYRTSRVLFVLLLLLVIVGIEARAQTPQNTEAAQTQTQTAQLPDFAQLNLSPDQIQKIRAINAE